MAAGVGNALYHFFTFIPYIAHFGLLTAIIHMQSYFFYTLVLSIGIAISQYRQKAGQLKKSPWRRYVLTPLSVTGFYCVLMTPSISDNSFFDA